MQQDNDPKHTANTTQDKRQHTVKWFRLAKSITQHSPHRACVYLLKRRQERETPPIKLLLKDPAVKDCGDQLETVISSMADTSTSEVLFAVTLSVPVILLTLQMESSAIKGAMF